MKSYTQRAYVELGERGEVDEFLFVVSRLGATVRSVQTQHVTNLQNCLQQPIRARIQEGIGIGRLNVRVHVSGASHVCPSHGSGTRVPMATRVVFPTLRIFLRLYVQSVHTLLAISSGSHPALLPESLVLLSVLLYHRCLLMVLRSVRMNDQVILVVLVIPDSNVRATRGNPVCRQRLPVLPIVCLSRAQRRNVRRHFIEVKFRLLRLRLQLKGQINDQGRDLRYQVNLNHFSKGRDHCNQVKECRHVLLYHCHPLHVTNPCQATRRNCCPRGYFPISRFGLSGGPVDFSGSSSSTGKVIVLPFPFSLRAG